MVAALITLIAWSTTRGPRYRVMICMSFKGNSSCRTVTAKSEEGAVRGATENACADIASGVTDTMNCERSDPKSIQWLSHARP